jgi:hydrogenase maturation protein HypF
MGIRGAVQGIGFRPFVFRLASELKLAGWVQNSNQGVSIEIEGTKPDLETFLARLETEKPSRSFIQSMECSWLDAFGHIGFAIRESESEGPKAAIVVPDIAICPDCLREIADPANRRYGYPFTNCTNCGPRFSIIESLPYDRANTSMKKFTMCSYCQQEYDNPLDRRFHAQPNACPLCGPHLELWDPEGAPISAALPFHEASLGRRPHADFGILSAAAEALRTAKILAVKGLGGFHLMVAAHDETAVRRLRELKHREEKPFAIMFPSLGSVKTACEVSADALRLLSSAEAPIVLLPAIRASAAGAGFGASGIVPLVAPNNPFLGVLLPYTPLHHLLLSLVGFPVVATSGNLSDEPICIDEHEALQRLGGIADLFLVHNRPIVRHVDDSVARIMCGREQILRRARGYAPLPVKIPGLESGSQSVLAVGGHLKNTIALSVGSHVFMSQHIGDLGTEQANCAFRKAIGDFQQLYQQKPCIIAMDAHPDYLSTKFARELCEQHLPAYDNEGGTPSAADERPYCISVQHHLAHVLSCLAENEVPFPVLGIAWDGTGYGLEGTIWGGEFLAVEENSWRRIAHLRQFRLPGGEAAIMEPRRTALGLLYEMLGSAAFANKSLELSGAFLCAELRSFKRMLERRINAPLTSSAGRLFDAVASLIGLRHVTRFEGQAAMDLEFALGGLQTEEYYPVELHCSAQSSEVRACGMPARSQPRLKDSTELAFQLDWSPLVRGVLADIESRTPVDLISARFHNGLVEAMIQVARNCVTERVLLTGGCFQNKYLLERAVERLQNEGFRPYWHQRVPPNDGGICLGQVVAAFRQSPSA